MLRKLRNETPADAPAPDDELFNLLAKSRGLIDERFALSLDRQLPDGGQSDVIAAYRSKDGSWGHREKSDIIAPSELRALLAHVRKRLIEFADRIGGGDIAVRPYRMGLTTPCAHCRFNGVCRFEPEQGYRPLLPMKRTHVLDRVIEEQAK
jgi:ATP-dependent helicase/nuclease subunit B